MTKLQRFMQLPRADKARLVIAAALLAAIRIGLWALPFQTFQRLFARIQRGRKPSEQGQLSVNTVVWSIDAVSRRMWWAATCLTRALAAQVMLERSGMNTCLKIGVNMDDKRELHAHAWLEAEGQVVIGGDGDLSEYTLLPPLPQGDYQ